MKKLLILLLALWTGLANAQIVEFSTDTTRPASGTGRFRPAVRNNTFYLKPSTGAAIPFWSVPQIEAAIDSRQPYRIVFILTPATIQAAINAAPTGSTVRIMPGTVNYTSDVAILFGGKTNVTLDATGVTFDGGTVAGTLLHVNASVTNCRITGGTFRSAKTGGGPGLLLVSELPDLIDGLDIDHCNFSVTAGQFNALSFQLWSNPNPPSNGSNEAAVVRKVRITDNRFTNCGRMGIEFLHQQVPGAGQTWKVQDVIVANNVFENMGTVDANYGQAISFDGQIQNLIISHNTIRESKRHGIETVVCQHVTIENNTIYNVTNSSTGIQITDNAQGRSKYLTIKGNSVRTTGRPFLIYESQYFTVAGNTFVGGQTVDVKSSNGSITGNTIIIAGTSSATRAINLDAAANNVVSGNYLDNSGSSPRYSQILLYGAGTTGNIVFGNRHIGTPDNNKYIEENNGAAGNIIGSVGFFSQVHTSGSSLSVSNLSNDISVLINPASALPSLTVNLPDNPADNQQVELLFGGTVTSGAVVTSLTISGTLTVGTYQNSPKAGDVISLRFKKSSGRWYVISPVPSTGGGGSSDPSVAVFTNVAALQAYSGTATVARVNGVSALYSYSSGSTETADGYDVVTATGKGSGRWLQADVLWFNVRDFGARGDGTTDDTQAFQRAINAAVKATDPAASNIATPYTRRVSKLYVPFGWYSIYDELMINGALDLELEGTGSYSGARIWQRTAGKHLFHLGRDTDGSSNVVRIHGGILRGPGGATGSDIALVYGGENNAIDGNNNSLYLYNVWFQTPQDYAVYLKRGDDLKIESCTFDVSLARAIKLGTATNEVSNAKIVGNTFFDIQQGVLNAVNTKGLIFKGNHVYGPNRTPYVVDVSSYDPVKAEGMQIEGNHIHSANRLINTTKGGITITNNVFLNGGNGPAVEIGGGQTVNDLLINDNRFEGDYSGLVGGQPNAVIWAWSTTLSNSNISGNLFKHTGAGQASKAVWSDGAGVNNQVLNHYVGFAASPVTLAGQVSIGSGGGGRTKLVTTTAANLTLNLADAMDHVVLCTPTGSTAVTITINPAGCTGAEGRTVCVKRMPNGGTGNISVAITGGQVETLITGTLQANGTVTGSSTSSTASRNIIWQYDGTNLVILSR